MRRATKPRRQIGRPCQVGREIRPSVGYFVGWSIIFDCVMNPIICVIWISMAAKKIVSA
jgi:hypothetical protein